MTSRTGRKLTKVFGRLSRRRSKACAILFIYGLKHRNFCTDLLSKSGKGLSVGQKLKIRERVKVGISLTTYFYILKSLTSFIKKDLRSIFLISFNLQCFFVPGTSIESSISCIARMCANVIVTHQNCHQFPLVLVSTI